MTKLRKILIAMFLVSLISYDPGAVERNSAVTGKLVPENIRITNRLSESSDFAGIERSINYFMKRWDIAGASVAISKDGRLVYAKGFGYADIAREAPVEPYSRFRVASISKLITAVAVMKLQEEGKLSVHDKVFGKEGILNDSIYSNPRDRRVNTITIAHLLAHEGGWTTRWGDQMFMPLIIADAMGLKPPVDARAIVRFALNKNLHFTPGSGRAYSNLGYTILGLVVEKVSGMAYSEYCNKAVLEPLGIYDFFLARNLSSDKAPYEVSYYEHQDALLKPSIYGTGEMVPASNGGNDIEALGGAGAWVATAPDLVKLMLAIDGTDTRSDILGRGSIDFMTDTGNGYAPIGWKATIYDGTWWRTGTFPGTSCMMKRQANGFTWVVLLNSSAWNGPEISTDINYLMARAMAQVRHWPEKDLFEYSLPLPLAGEHH